MKKLSEIFRWKKETLIFFGPGLLLAITAAGEAGITEALEIGSHFGFSLLWVVLIALLFKYAFTTGIARYTLATGKTIFEGVDELPGPKHWGSIFTVLAFLMETLAIGAMIVFAATFLNYLIPGSYTISLTAVFILILALLILRSSIYHHFEVVMAVLTILLGICMVVILIDFPITSGFILSGLTPNIPDNSETAILALIGVVGSGLNLMLYSVWLEQCTRGNEKVKEKTHFSKYLKSVKFDIAFGFIIVTLITIGCMAIGYSGFQISFMEDGTALTLDNVVSFATTLFSQIPLGEYIFLGIITIIFLGAITIGLDARASAITKIVKQVRSVEGKPVKNPSVVYNIALLILALITILALFINSPLGITRAIACLSAILFGIFGFIIIYLNSKLPEHARGSRLWIFVIGLGSLISIAIALILEGNILAFGVNILKNLLLCLLIVYIFIKSKLFTRCVSGTGTIFDKLWMILICTAISILGTIGAVELPISGFILGFGVLGAIIAGLIGGVGAGVLTGLLSGIFSLSWSGKAFSFFSQIGDSNAIVITISLIVAGLVSGMAVQYWKGQITILRAILLALVVSCVNLLVILPTVTLIMHPGFGWLALKIIGATLPSLFIVLSAGLVAFVYFSRNTTVYKGGLKKISLKRLKKEIGDFIKKEDKL